MMQAMGYATPQDLAERYSERDLRNITDPDGQQVDYARAQRALDDAGDEMDTWLQQRYVLPLAYLGADKVTVLPLPAPPVLVRCCCDIAVYRLQELRREEDIKDARRRYEDVLVMLKRLSLGEVDIATAILRPDVADNPATQAVGLPQFGNAPMGGVDVDQPFSNIFGRRYR